MRYEEGGGGKKEKDILGCLSEVLTTEFLAIVRDIIVTSR